MDTGLIGHKNQGNASIGKQMMSASKFYMGYSRWDDAKDGYETWDESCARVINMHRDKYANQMSARLEALMLEAEAGYKQQLVLGAQRALQFGGAQLRKHEARMYNCASSYCDRAAFFQETMYLLLCGCGVGFSVQKHHVAKLPRIKARSSDDAKVFQVQDSIEGWADAFGVLLSSYFVDGGTFHDYKGKQVLFDFSLIRPKGAMISGGFKAPGPDGLRNALQKCEALLEAELKNRDFGDETAAIKTITAYDFVMHMSDAVLAGGVRRSATICLFSKDDEAMLNAKTGDWFVTNPQRGRSNNSVMLLRNELTREEWANIMKSVRSFGEPGFIFTDSLEFTYNPCVEIGKRPVCVQTGETGFQFCNLTEINGGQCTTVERFYRACRVGAILGTLQAGYTDFKYVSDATRRITAHEALIGVSITGWMNNPHILFDEEVLKRGAQIVNETNREVAALIDINAAARTTCAKPSGNASVILGTASGVHGEHAPRYFRNVQMNENDEVLKLIQEVNPSMVEKSVWSTNGTDYVVSFPVVSHEGSIYKSDLYGVKQLEYVKKAQQHWVENGTNLDLCVDKRLRHNISNTISVDDWDAVEQYIYDNRQWFAGISLLSSSGDKDYAQAPFTEVYTPEQLVEQYGEAAMFASGLIVDALHAFENNLWVACSTALGFGLKLTDGTQDLLRRDWVRRFNKFAANFFPLANATTADRLSSNNEVVGDTQKTTYCLKDCFNLHRWVGIQRTMKHIDFATALSKQTYVDANTMGSQACAGGACEITF